MDTERIQLSPDGEYWWDYNPGTTWRDFMGSVWSCDPRNGNTVLIRFFRGVTITNSSLTVPSNVTQIIELFPKVQNGETEKL